MPTESKGQSYVILLPTSNVILRVVSDTNMYFETLSFHTAFMTNTKKLAGMDHCN